MIKVEKQNIISKIQEGGIIAIIRRLNPNLVKKVVDALVEGGVTAIELTMDTEDSLNLIKHLSAKYQGSTVIGAGTVLDEQAAYQAIKHGAEFLISPSLHRKVIETTIRYGKVSIPGAYTPTEMVDAVQHGADMVKVFPARKLEASYIGDLKAPLQHIPMIPTGGVSIKNIESYISAGASALGVGSNLTDNKMVHEQRYTELSNLAKQYVDAVQIARKA